jgi:4-amino-4-deoxy-L-arabinose transferase-like glycosyltransferase
LASTRRLVALFGIVCAIAVAALGQVCRGPVTGFVAGIGFALNGLVVESYTHALFDMIALAFSSLAVLALIVLLKPLWGASVGQRTSIRNGLIVGILLALAVGTKMNALIAVLVTLELMLILGMRWMRSRDRRTLTSVLLLGLSLIVGLFLFIAVNPAMYGDLFNGLRDLFVIQARTVQVQSAFLPDHLVTLGNKVRAVGTLLCGHSAGLLVLVVATLWPTWEGLRRFSPRTVVVLWWWTALAAVIAWIPFPWPRYVLPVLAPAAILCADTCVGSCAAISKRLSGKPAPIKPSVTV